MRVVIAGGGTAGHVFPGLALARALSARGHEVSFIGTERGVEARLIPAAGFRFDVVPAAPLLRKVSWTTIRAPLVALRAMRAAREVVRNADVVVGMGGYVSIPAALAAARERVPVVLHEQNAVPGLANRMLSRRARTVALSFADAEPLFPRHPGSAITVTGNPVREEILRVAEGREVLAKEGRRELDLLEDRRTIVIFGGSQGALHIDRAAVGACRLLEGRSDLQVVLITGPAHLGLIERAGPGGESLTVRLFGFVERMELVYACADLVVSRSGATTAAEVTACGLPSLLIPYPYATGRHQEANARSLQRSGAADVLLDDQVTGESLADRILSLIDSPERLRSMGERARACGRPDAAERLADAVTAAAWRTPEAT
ncbi:MAG TPA: undecaprenyldiphospho-muramoylpentapeptide beta-N-acetylglucosaminyltransferase [Actinobacteria bacterium]|nr:undecaprenyldiphospho-muramoylpentapeptide beta-N-acetylglucosaminyltransferase [Actinomycetota bacterium]HCP62461.1 undecaprenyldiphospho-muramoylpentapeptide beta-N-acetylglucosaminyltransferase [Actinomycetota bacterium]